MNYYRIIRHAQILLIGTLLSGCEAVVAQAPATPPNNGEVTTRMQQLRGTLDGLMRSAADEKALATASGRQDFGEQLRALSGFANVAAMPQHKIDASLQVIGNLFHDETQRALKLYERGDLPAARHVSLNLSGYCVGCHTADAGGKQLHTPARADYLKKLAPLERADFLAATRQFDAAKTEYLNLINDRREVGNINWTRAVRRALTIAVRVEQSPQQALKILQQAEAPKQVPVYFRKDLAAWRRTLEEWHDEKTTLDDQEPLMAKTFKSLLAQAKARRAYPADQGADIDFLRASAAAHTYMKTYPNGASLGEALLALGESYQALTDLDLWPLHNTYYEACVRRFAHQPIAGRCFEHYEESVYLEYTGSAGTSLPEDEFRKLTALRKLAQ